MSDGYAGGITSLFSLREVADDFNAGKCQLQADVTLRIGDETTQWELVIEGERLSSYDAYGRECCLTWLHRPDAKKDESQPDLMEGQVVRSADVVSEVFGVHADARVWRKSSTIRKK